MNPTTANHKRHEVYLDNAATTPTDPRVLEKALPFFTEQYGNPSALYERGRITKDAILEARETIARYFHCKPGEILFTGSGTESDNMAILGAAHAYEKKGEQTKGHIITQVTEHHAVLNACQALEREGFEVTYLGVDAFGMVSVDAVRTAIKDNTILISVMYANNEIGTIQPIAEIAQLLAHIRKEKKTRTPILHTDACQATGYLSMNVDSLGVDLVTINGSKIYGMKGTGALYVRQGVQIKPMIFGGQQERKLRPGTENVAGIVALGEAVKLARDERETEIPRLEKLREKLISGLIASIPKSRLNGHPTHRLPNNVNITILDIEGEALLLYLDEYGVMASTGSACDSETLDPSHVIVSLGVPYEYAHGSIRFSLGRQTTEEDIDYVLEIMPHIVEKLRHISPLNLSLDADPTKIQHAQIKQSKKIGA